MQINLTCLLYKPRHRGSSFIKLYRHLYCISYIGFVVKGYLRQFRIGDNGQEHIIRFAVENWWVSDFESFLSGQPSKSYIDALENSEILIMEKANFEMLIQTIPNFKSLIDKLTTKNFEVHQARIFQYQRISRKQV